LQIRREKPMNFIKEKTGWSLDNAPGNDYNISVEIWGRAPL
jgi:hypothetical protein